VGNIGQDSKVNNVDFALCRNDSTVIQYFSLTYMGNFIDEKEAILEDFNEN